MHLIRIQTLLFLSVIISYTSKAQLSIKSPQICHNTEKRLVCLNDDDFLFTFSDGEFLEFKAPDKHFQYSNLSKTITFLSKELKPQVHFDTITISLLQKSILLKRGEELVEIDSLSQLKEGLNSFGIGYFSINGIIKGLAFSVGGTVFKIEISTFHKSWVWDIKIEKEAKTILLEYNGFKHNRLNRIYVRDEKLRCGWVVSTSFRTNKKVESLESVYSDTLNVNGVTTRTNIIPPNQGFYFGYKKSGKLKSVREKGELKLCDCGNGF